MNVFGLFNISRTEKAMSSVPARGWHRILEPFAGAWQKNIEINPETVLSFHADFACRTLIASDIAKLPLILVAKDSNGIWKSTTNPAYSPVLRKPNKYQNARQFVESWMLSKLQNGNTYVLKEFDNRGVVVALHVLDPRLVRPLISDNGDVFYQVTPDKLTGQTASETYPARYIVHDRWNTMFHPLIGVSPIFASGLAATQGLSIQNNSANFFRNGAMPSGVLTVPGAIDQDKAQQLATRWNDAHGGNNSGKTGILTDGVTYSPLSAKAVDSQLLEQLKWTAEVVCSVYHVPPYKIGIGQMPAYNNVQALNLEYYAGCLQSLIEAFQACLDEGLGLDGVNMGVEFDLDALLWMDSATQVDVASKMQGVATLDEQRAKLNLPPVPGGDTIYLQQQDHSLAAIGARDRQLIDQANNPPAPTPVNDNTQAEEMQAATSKALELIQKGFSNV